MAESGEAKPHPSITHAALFSAFFKVGIFGFGGVAAFARHVVVVERKWLDERDFAELFGVSSTLPGANTVNFATLLGDRHAGSTGAGAAIAGLLGAPLLILVVIATLYARFAELPDVRAGVAGAAAAAAGLVIGTALKLLRALGPDAVMILVVTGVRGGGARALAHHGDPRARHSDLHRHRRFSRAARKMTETSLFQLLITFGLVSLFAIGGANATLPEIHRQVVEHLHWMDDPTFVSLVAIGQTAPGPNVLIVSLIGWHRAGWAGLVVATLAIIGPSSLIALGVGRFMRRHETNRWVGPVRRALAPIAIGLMLASGLVMTRAAYGGILTLGVVVGVTGLVLLTRLSPLWGIAAGAMLGVIGNRLYAFG